MKLGNIRLVLLALAGSVGGYAFAQSTADGVVGKMGNVEIKTADLRRIIEAQPAPLQKQIAGTPGELDRLVRNELVRQALLNEAKAKGLDRKPDVVLMMERAREQALLQIYMSEVAKPPAGFPSEEDVKQAYEANKSALSVPAQYHLAQIFIASPDNADKPSANAAAKKATEVGNKARAKGADFSALARDSSDHKDTAAKGGDLGWLPDNQIIAEIRNALARMDKGDVSAPVRSASGWHIVKLIDKRAAGVRPLAEVRETIVTQMRARRMQEIERNYIEGMISRSQFNVNPNELSKLQSAAK
jgi:parvulin-like peptidyl-prolyl isomerase